MKLEKYSFGTGDRFGRQGKAQLDAMFKAKQAGIDIVPVWNKSHREHSIIHTRPESVRMEADAAVKELGWTGSYYVDADHINMSNVDLFIDFFYFFTLDVADYIGKTASQEDITAFMEKYKEYIGKLNIDGIDEGIEVTEGMLVETASKVLLAVQEAGNSIVISKTKRVKAISSRKCQWMKPTWPSTPVEMLFILAAIADEGIPVKTIAPKFTGRFNKGVDYVGDVSQFEKEFNQDLAVIRYAVKELGLPENLKLSIHSGSDKFCIYGPISRAIKNFDAGIHLKTAGTTWLERDNRPGGSGWRRAGNC